ncbi:DUF6191 domain-containing protein [Streptomyces sp. BE20]|uniref:DUF6191 domain-containing protein n=1 Tax=Streptomyces sp. BE20 TaxID=3002525 RepID=UPI002E784703|nr:DUF6191 domain-containing protein [Streptomyces sp. BE20]MEE1823566.1 DUF6191 domain-containing protein [Streptomyces sp. BE20]
MRPVRWADVVMVIVVIVLVALVTGLVALVWAGQAARRARLTGRAAGPARSGGAVVPGMTAFEELHALFSAGKRVQVEQRQARLVLRDDDRAGAPPRTGVDLDAGTAVLRRGQDRGPGTGEGGVTTSPPGSP